MRVRTDDEVYRVNAVWLGPPKATFPWAARYVAYGVGIPVFLALLFLERQVGIGFGFFSTAWALVATVAITRFLCGRITHDRPLGAVLAMAAHELNTPRFHTRAQGAAAAPGTLPVRATRPRSPSRSATHTTPR